MGTKEVFDLVGRWGRTCSGNAGHDPKGAASDSAANVSIGILGDFKQCPKRLGHDEVFLFGHLEKWSLVRHFFLGFSLSLEEFDGLFVTHAAPVSFAFELDTRGATVGRFMPTTATGPAKKKRTIQLGALAAHGVITGAAVVKAPVAQQVGIA